MAEAIGPRQVCRMTCNGCPALKTEYWVEYPDGERDSGTTGTCTAASKCISNYWHESDRVPAWCPAGVKEAPRINPLCGVHGPIPCEGAGCICTRGVQGTKASSYKLLDHGDVIQCGDEVLADDTVNWLPLVGWEVGMKWGCNFMPMRRPAGVKGLEV